MGNSISRYEYSSNITVGVNDVNKFFTNSYTDYLCVVDLPNAFSKERLNTIVNSQCQKFFTPFDQWRPLVQRYQQIKLAAGRGNLTELNNKQVVCYSNNSTFVATVLAYKIGAKEIFLYGADFNDHPNFTGDSWSRAIEDFRNLDKMLSINNCKLRVTNESALSKYITPF